MKRILSIILTVVMTAALLITVVSAAEENTHNVYVTILDGDGKLAVTHESISVSDIDGDSKITVNDVLYCAHEAKYNGGADAGYASVNGEFGLSVTKLWGVENGGSYGYYVDNAMAMSLADEVKDGSYVVAFVYTDTVTFADTFCYFEKSKCNIEESLTVELKLSKLQFNMETYASDEVPVVNADITVNGEKVNVKTDSEGKATVTFNDYGVYTVSAVSESEKLVSPICIVNLMGIAIGDTDTTDTTDTTTTEVTESTSEVSTSETESKTEAATEEEKSGCSSVISSAVVVIAVIGIAAVAVKKDEE